MNVISSEFLKKPDVRLASIEGLRFISALAIVFYHYTIYIDRTPKEFSGYITNFHLFVDLFFVISGFVISLQYSNRRMNLSGYTDFMLRRFARLYPLHLATLLFYALVAIMLLGGYLKVVSENKYDFAEFVPNLLMVHAWGFGSTTSFNYVSWTISAELFAYFIFPVLRWSMCRGALTGLALIIFSFALGEVLARELVGREMTRLTVPLSIIRIIPSFCFGIWLYLYSDLLAKIVRIEYLRSGVVVLLSSTIILCVTQNNSVFTMVSIYLLVLFAVSSDIRGVSSILSWQPISSLGKLTYSVYMLHTIVATIFISFVFPKIFGTSFQAKISSVLIALPIVFIVSTLSYKLFEMPARLIIIDFFKRYSMRSKSLRARQ